MIIANKLFTGIVPIANCYFSLSPDTFNLIHVFLVTDLIRKFEKVVAGRLTPLTQVDKTGIPDNKLHSTAVEEAPTSLKPATKELTETKPKPKEVVAPGVGSEAKELTFEGLWQGLRLKKDIQLGKISEPTWKEQKHTVSKVTLFNIIIPVIH